MGSGESSLRKKKYLSEEEIGVLVAGNINILTMYKKFKNSDGLLTTNELNIITYGLINPKTRKKIIQICGSKSDTLDFKDLKWVVSVYAFILALNPMTALMLNIMNGWSSTTLILLFVGGISFAISDLVLSNTYFGEGHEKPIDFILNYIFYYGAQFLIAFSIFFL